LNHWIYLSGHPPPSIELRDPGIKPRDVGLSTILERLIFLENGFEEDYEDLLYANLYKNLLRDPDRYLNPHRAMYVNNLHTVQCDKADQEMIPGKNK